jgi:hypothetical protein
MIDPNRLAWTVILILDSGWLLLATSIYLARSGIYPQ